ATATTTEAVMVVHAQSLNQMNQRRSRSHWPHPSPATALHAFSSSVTSDSPDWGSGGSVTQTSSDKGVSKDNDWSPTKGDGHWLQRLGRDGREDAAVLQWKRAQDEKILQEQESRWRVEEAKRAEDLDAAEKEVTREESAVPAENAVQDKEGAAKEEAATAAPAATATPTTPLVRKGDGKKIRSLLAELQDVMQKYLRRSHREERQHHVDDDNGIQGSSHDQNTSSWWPRPEDLARASLRVLVACRQGLDREEDLPDDGQDGQDARHVLPRIRECLRRRLLAAVDSLVAADSIPIAYGVSLVRRSGTRSGEDRAERDSDFPEDDVEAVSETASDRPLLPRVLSKVASLFTTHDLRIGYGVAVEEGRRRHHYRKVFPVLVTGFMILMSLMVPLGFQFMAMIGGKALLMSKVALIMASMYNFRR
ncbi:uncharacterized protein LOC117649512, partial [Thrips palmi]|uniref:Uncharacterized protein LOC117649512 n=1 Tax=Thrips palmi TaxID=161013 RepID=A0A6P8ZSQ8_THRPL